MEDIIDIYEPIYTEPSHLPLILIILGSLLLLAGGIFLLIRFLKRKKADPQRYYNEIMKVCLQLKDSIETTNSRDFSYTLTRSIGKYMSAIYNKNFSSKTRDELEFEFNTHPDLKKYRDAFFIIMKYLGPAKFARYEIPEAQKSSVLHQVVETMTDMHQDYLERETNV